VLLSQTVPLVNPTSHPSGRLTLQGVTVRVPVGGAPDAVTLLHDIQLDCRPGEFVVIVGPSGCGKSTLLNVAAGFQRPTSGSVLLDGKPVVGPSHNRAVVLQEHALFPWLTARQNVEFGLRMLNVPPNEREERTRAALAQVHLSHAADRLPRELSGGMRQRVAIARALVLRPAVLLMDEPFASVDAQTRTLLHSQLQHLWLQLRTTVLFVTHSVGEAVRLADRILVMSAEPGAIRRQFDIDLPHPRRFDSPAIAELAGKVRREINDEVARLRRLRQDRDDWQPDAPDDETLMHFAEGI
jgi:NitT/TauT family transport system ATP-binding protein